MEGNVQRQETMNHQHEHILQTSSSCATYLGNNSSPQHDVMNGMGNKWYMWYDTYTLAAYQTVPCRWFSHPMLPFANQGPVILPMLLTRLTTTHSKTRSQSSAMWYVSFFGPRIDTRVDCNQSQLYNTARALETSYAPQDITAFSRMRPISMPDIAASIE